MIALPVITFSCQFLLSSSLTIHLQLMPNLEHSAIARAAMTLASRDAAVVPTTVEAVTVDSLILPEQHVAVLKVLFSSNEPALPLRFCLFSERVDFTCLTFQPHPFACLVSREEN